MILETFLILAALPFVGLTIFFGTKGGYYDSDDYKDGNRFIQEFYGTSGKAVRITSRDLLLTTELAEGEVKG